MEYAEKLGVIVAIEPVCRHIVNNAKRARKVLDAIDSPNLQIIFDPVNLLNESNYQEYPAIFKEFVEILGPDIATIHAKDFKIENGSVRYSVLHAPVSVPTTPAPRRLANTICLL